MTVPVGVEWTFRPTEPGRFLAIHCQESDVLTVLRRLAGKRVRLAFRTRDNA